MPKINHNYKEIAYLENFIKCTTQDGQIHMIPRNTTNVLEKNSMEQSAIDDDLYDRFPDDYVTLEKLSEEACEIGQAKSKIILFGLKDIYQNTVNEPIKTNQEKLETEVVDLLAVIDVLIARGILRREKIYDPELKKAKWNKMEKWNKYGKGTKGDF